MSLGIRKIIVIGLIMAIFFAGNRYGFSRRGADGKNRIGLSAGLEAGVFEVLKAVWWRIDKYDIIFGVMK